jgi:hypothetical protein
VHPFTRLGLGYKHAARRQGTRKTSAPWATRPASRPRLVGVRKLSAPWATRPASRPPLVGVRKLSAPWATRPASRPRLVGVRKLSAGGGDGGEGQASDRRDTEGRHRGQRVAGQEGPEAGPEAIGGGEQEGWQGARLAAIRERRQPRLEKGEGFFDEGDERQNKRRFV